MEFSRRIETALDSIRKWSKSSAAQPALQRRAARCKAVYRNRRCRPSAVARAPECGLVVQTGRRLRVGHWCGHACLQTKGPAAYPSGSFHAQHHHPAVRLRCAIPTGHCGIVAAASGISGHVQPDWPVTMLRKCAHVGPESAVTLLRKPHDRPRKCQRQVCSKAVSAWGDARHSNEKRTWRGGFGQRRPRPIFRRRQPSGPEKTASTRTPIVRTGYADSVM